jgi:hypothetical protein
MAKVIEKRPDGTAVVVVPAVDASKLDVDDLVDVRPLDATGGLPWPFGALAGKYPSFEGEEIKAARHEALVARAG